jgi:NAD(P) transhydrogenase subunit alpha
VALVPESVARLKKSGIEVRVQRGAGESAFIPDDAYANAGAELVADAAAALGDCDGDGDLDLEDFACFAECLVGPEGGLLPDCETFDADADGDVDLYDWAEISLTY